MSHDPGNPTSGEHGSEPGLPGHTLQAYVDGELTEAERDEVARSLERSASARAYVREQQEVRTLLRSSGARLTAPSTLHARVTAALDEVDLSRSGAAPAERLRGLRAIARGTLVMAPAAAAAVGLFFVVQSGALTDARGPSPAVAVLGAPTAGPAAMAAGPAAMAPTRRAVTPHDAPSASAAEPATTPPSAPASTVRDPIELAGLEGFDFSGGFEAPARLPEGVTLVSADRHGANNASHTGTDALEVSYVDRHTGGRLVDVQRPLVGLDAGASAARADELTVRRDGTDFWLRRDAAGRAHLRFHDGRVEHALRHHGGETARVGAPVVAEDPGFATLLDLALTIRQR